MTKTKQNIKTSKLESEVVNKITSSSGAHPPHFPRMLQVGLLWLKHKWCTIHKLNKLPGLNQDMFKLIKNALLFYQY